MSKEMEALELLRCLELEGTEKRVLEWAIRLLEEGIAHNSSHVRVEYGAFASEELGAAQTMEVQGKLEFGD